MKKAGFYLVAIATVFIGLMVGTLNSAPVQLDLLWVQFELPLGLAVLLGFGVLIGLLLLYLARVLPLNVQLRKARSKLARQDIRDQNLDND